MEQTGDYEECSFGVGHREPGQHHDHGVADGHGHRCERWADVSGAVLMDRNQLQKYVK